MTDYIPFTEEQREQARQTDLVAFLRQCGEIVKPSSSEYQWNNEGQKITIRGNVWYNQYTQEGGDAIAFAQHFFNFSYQDAVQYMLAMNCGIAVPSYTSYPAVAFKLPEKHDNMRRVYAYLLSQRGIDKAVLDAFVYRNLIYESAKYHNVVFVGKDKEETPPARPQAWKRFSIYLQGQHTRESARVQLPLGGCVRHPVSLRSPGRSAFVHYHAQIRLAKPQLCSFVQCVG